MHDITVKPVATDSPMVSRTTLRHSQEALAGRKTCHPDQLVRNRDAGEGQERPSAPGRFRGGIHHQAAVAGTLVTELAHSRAASFAAHAHDWNGVVLHLGGSYAERIGDEWIERKPNTVVFRRAGDDHADRIGHRGAWFLSVELAPSAIDCLWTDRAMPLPWTLWQQDAVTRLGWRVLRALRCGGIGDDSLEHDLAAYLAILQPGRDYAGGAPPAWLRRVAERLDETPHLPHPISELAREADVHPAHLSRAFKAYVGETIGAHLRALRVARALRLLEDETVGVARAALLAGFCDQSHLTRVLRRHTGFTPRQYRQLIGHYRREESATLAQP